MLENPIRGTSPHEFTKRVREAIDTIGRLQ